MSKSKNAAVSVPSKVLSSLGDPDTADVHASIVSADTVAGTDVDKDPGPEARRGDGDVVVPHCRAELHRRLVRVDVSEGDAVLVIAGDIDAADRGVLAAFAARLGDALDLRRMDASIGQVEDVRRGDELRAALLAAVGHDLRTPLASIKASVSSLLADDVDWPAEAVQQFHATIDAETDRLTALLENLLDMSRIAAGARPRSTSPSTRPCRACRPTPCSRSG